MPVLPYCILLRDTAVSAPEKGILDSRIHPLTEGALLAVYSEVERSAIAPKTFQPAALEFHRVIQSVFSQVAVVPFRFPTWLTPTELGEHMQQQSERYTEFLTHHANRVQMELRLTPPSISSPTDATSGTAHLRARAAESRRLRNTAKTLENLLSSEVVEWSERDTPQGLRLYALVDRTNIAGFRERLSKREHEFSVRWSGPWPATEFLPPGRSEHEGQ
jgi:hypothetical protein